MKKIPFFKFGSPTTCTYCGDLAQSIDHVIAIASQGMGRSQGHLLKDFGPVTHACSNCNAILGYKSFNTFLDRCNYLSERFNDRVKPILWSEKELKTLNITLQDYIRREANKSRWFRYRADWFQSRDFFMNIESLIWEPCLEQAHPKFNEELFLYFKQTIEWIKVSQEQKTSWEC